MKYSPLSSEHLHTVQPHSHTRRHTQSSAQLAACGETLQNVCVCVFCHIADLNKQKMENIKEKMERGAVKKLPVRLSGDAH